MKEFCALRAKTYAYLMDDDSEKNKAMGTKKCHNTILRSQLRFKSDLHNVYTEEENKIALNSNDEKRLQTDDRITTYLYGTNAYKVCENEMIAVKKICINKNVYITRINLATINQDKDIL